MEKNLNRPDDLLEDLFHLKEKDYSQYSPLTLAYIGDAVFDLAVRTVLVRRANRQPHKLHQAASKVVSAPAQAAMAAVLYPVLTQEETDVFRRGKNAKPATGAKNASHADYMEATGFEALLGWLYLTRQYTRLLELIEKGITESGRSL